MISKPTHMVKETLIESSSNQSLYHSLNCDSPFVLGV